MLKNKNQVGKKLHFYFGTFQHFNVDIYNEQQNITSIAQRANVSTATVNRILDTIHFPKMMLPEALSIDEFKGNA